MSVMNFNTANQTYRQLMGNGLIYSVPRFQRDYSWTEEEWDDMWADVQDILAPENKAGDATTAHYMGYLVLQSRNNKNFDIIDGQQRLTTLAMIVLATLKCFERLIAAGVEAEPNTRRKEQLRSTFIGYLDPVSLVPQSKLNLNRNNNSIYQNYLVPLQPIPKRGLKASEHQMRKAFEWFENKIWQLYGTKQDGALLARLLEEISDNVFFTIITVTDELNAYKVFETLNARGVKLSSTDLLKNYLFSVIHSAGADERELQALEERWEVLVGKLGSEDFPDFLRAHWNSMNAFVRHAELFKTIRARITSKGEAFALVRAMEQDADVYGALSKPEDTLWKREEQRRHIDELRMFNVRQVYPLLLAGFRRLSAEDFTSLLRACSIISFRYNVIGNFPPNEQERLYTSVAAQVSSGRLVEMPSILTALRSIYPDDTAFEHAFADKVLKTRQARNKRVVRYILFALERQSSGQGYEQDSDLYDIEHILPEHPGDGWEHISDEEHEQAVYRLGNMTLLRAADNRAAGNGGYTVKREYFAKSTFETTQRIAAENTEEWTPERIAARQRQMAKM